jgi:class 3 adenylate cyclase
MNRAEKPAGWWQRWVQRGVQPSMSAGERRAIIVTNEAATLVAGVSLASLARPDMHGPLWWFLQAASYACVPVLMGLGWTRLAPRFFALSAIAWISFISVQWGTEAAVHFFLITVAVGVWQIAGPGDQRFATLTALVASAVFVGFVVHPLPPLTGAPPSEIAFSRALNLVLTVVILFGFSVHAYLRTNEAEKHLEVARAKSESLLLNVLPSTIAERLKERPGSIADRFDEATILFADIVNFTVLSERVSPVALVGMLDQVFTRFDALCDQYRLEKIKTIGDAYMVAAGIPEPRSDHVEAVAAMALEMGRVLDELKGDDFAQLNIRIGIHSGPVVAGVIGQRKFAYDLWGDAVNTASRMESHGLPGRIHVSRAVYERLKGAFAFEQRGAITVKGKGELETWFLLGRA